ncbi:three-prime repair exonuclease 1-like [Centruroides sculpturatus]|uniref:three-prime repair exonuclease 1-like n=1 Tax=Centruroides sculpturatus TaxID=218467 RepID=UPI000C6D8A34|nr:three-prime repair exonuclease 1-like [Centruroides sculpturatus]
MASADDVEIQTLVFFDTETTGLPVRFSDNRNVQITELSLVAVDRREFESNKENIRVINKLNLCFRPSCDISSGAAKVSGLTDSLLQFQETFINSAELIILFLERLNKPICILAHNGDKFDFPLLRAEFINSRMDISKLMFCADTLLAFKSILPNTDIKIQSSSVRNEDLDQNDVKRNTSADKKTPSKSKVEIVSYKLSSLYEYFFNCSQPDSHEAEGDTLALLKMAKKINDQFLTWMEENKVPFETINSLWKIEYLTDDLTNVHLDNKCNNDKDDNIVKDNIDFLKSSSSNEICKNSADMRQISEDQKLCETKSPVKEPLFTNSPDVKQNTCVDKKTPLKIKVKISDEFRSLYNYFFNCPLPDSRTAEGDALALLKMAKKVNDQFLTWLEENIIPFDSIPIIND